MKIGINLATPGSEDTTIFNNLMLQCQPARSAPEWSPGGHEMGSGMSTPNYVNPGLTWTTLRDGSIVASPHLAGTYRNTSSLSLTVNGVTVAPGADISLTTGVGQLQIFINNQTQSPAAWPSLERVGSAKILQPKVGDLCVNWDFVRTMEGERVQHVAGTRTQRRLPFSRYGMDFRASARIGYDLGMEVHIAIDLDTMMNDALLEEALRQIDTSCPTGQIGLHVINEVWNTVLFSEAVRLVALAGGDFWAGMSLYAQLVTKLKQRVASVVNDPSRFTVQCETNQHIGGLTERLRNEAEYDIMMLNGYLYMDSSDVTTAIVQLNQSLDHWTQLTEPFTDEPWGLYEKGIHITNAGTSNVNPGAIDALRAITRQSDGFEITTDHLGVCEELGAESVAAYCMEREPRNEDPKAISEFGLRQGLLSGEEDSRVLAYLSYPSSQPSVPKTPEEGDVVIPKPKVNPILDLVQSLDDNLKAASADMTALNNLLKKK